MSLTTISEISKRLSISTRTLRYYEQIGWIEEHLNYWDWNISTEEYRQIDLMIPIKLKNTP